MRKICLVFIFLVVMQSASLALPTVASWGSYGSGDGQFIQAYSLAIGSDDNIYVADLSNYRIQKFDSNGNFIMKWSMGHVLFAPFALAIDSDNNVYAVMRNVHRVRKFDNLGNTILEWGTPGWGGPGDIGDGNFYLPEGIATSFDDLVYVVDTFNDRIQKFDSNGNFLTKWGSYGSGDGQFMGARDAAVDSDGNVYVLEASLNKRVQKFTSDGTFIGCLAGGVPGWQNPCLDFSQGSADGEFHGPRGIFIDSSDCIYVTEATNRRVQKFDSQGNFITKWGSNGTGLGEFKDPKDIVVDSNGNVFVVDSYLPETIERIQKFFEHDQDGWITLLDTCPVDFNPDQLDSDGNAPGDVCDPCPADSNNDCKIAASNSSSIGTAGGALATLDNNCQLTVPAGALPSDTSVSITGFNQSTLEGFKVGGKDHTAYSDVYTLTPSPYAFGAPVTVRIYFHDFEGKLADINIFKDLGGGIYEPQPAICLFTVKPEGFCEVDLNDFSTYLVGGFEEDEGGLSTCAVMGGASCSAEQYCSNSIVPAADTAECCLGQCLAIPRPDLVISELTVPDPLIIKGDLTPITVKLANQGTLAAESFELLLAIEDPYTVLAQESISGLDIGSSIQFTFEYDFNDFDGLLTLRAMADSTGTIEEENEENNSFLFEIFIKEPLVEEEAEEELEEPVEPQEAGAVDDRPAPTQLPAKPIKTEFAAIVVLLENQTFTVTDEFGIPVAGAEIEIVLPFKDKPRTVTLLTDAAGKATFLLEEEGKFAFTIKAPEMKEYYGEFTVLSREQAILEAPFVGVLDTIEILGDFQPIVLLFLVLIAAYIAFKMSGVLFAAGAKSSAQKRRETAYRGLLAALAFVIPLGVSFLFRTSLGVLFALLEIVLLFAAFYIVGRYRKSGKFKAVKV